MSDGEDDYMSDNFLAKTEEVRPGLTSNYRERRLLKIEAERREIEEEQRRANAERRKPAGMIRAEHERREESLAKPLSAESKGFALMAKMGFKPGMSLGKKKDENDLGSGIIEPIPIVIRGHRGGLGIEAEDEKKEIAQENGAKDRIKAEMERMKARAKMTDMLMDDFRKRKRAGSSQKQLIGDILKSRKTCQDLDMRIEMDEPEEPWYWPSYRDRSLDTEPSVSTRKPVEEEEEEDEAVYRYANGKVAPREERLDMLMEDDLEDRLMQITAYLRGKHFYCLWCGCVYENEEDLGGQCPGSSRSDHDDLD